MKIPPLSVLYQQKVDFQAHKKKLQKIKIERKANLIRQIDNKTTQTIAKRHNNNYVQKFNARSVQIKKENDKIAKKVESLKSAYSFRQSLTLNKRDSRTSNMLNTNSRTIEQQRQNFRLRERVMSMNSSLNSKKLIDDYRKSTQIKKRISHFKTEQNKIVLKVEKYLSGSSVKSNTSKSQQMFKKLIDSPEALPPLQHKNLLDKKMNNEALFYKKEDIMKNKIKASNKMFKMAREKRLRSLFNQ